MGSYGGRGGYSGGRAVNSGYAGRVGGRGRGRGRDFSTTTLIAPIAAKKDEGEKFPSAYV